jgi:predicted HD phosphohydrolase
MKVFTLDTMDPVFELLEATRGVTQMDAYHPEGDVFVHSLQVLGYAFRESHDTDLILAAMLHDIGKRENSLGHEKIAIKWLEPHTSVKTLWLIENHMRVWYYIYGEMRKLQKCLDFAHHPWLPELVQLARWDKMGRNPGKKPPYDREVILSRLNEKVPLHFKGFKGP